MELMTFSIASTVQHNILLQLIVVERMQIFCLISFRGLLVTVVSRVLLGLKVLLEILGAQENLAFLEQE